MALIYVLLFRLHRKAIDARRLDRTWRYFAWSVVAGLAAGGLVAFATMFVSLLISIGLWWFAIPFALYLFLPAFEPLIARHIYAPLGLAQLAYWSAGAATTKDPEGYALAIAARVCAP